LLLLNIVFEEVKSRYNGFFSDLTEHQRE